MATLDLLLHVPTFLYHSWSVPECFPYILGPAEPAGQPAEAAEPPEPAEAATHV